MGACTCGVFHEDMVSEVLYDSVVKELLDTVGERKDQWMDWSFDGCVSVCQTVCQCVGIQCMYVSVWVWICMSGCFLSVWVCQCVGV